MKRSNLFFRLNEHNQVIPCSYKEWALGMQSGLLQVGYTEVTSAILVSTVFIGIALPMWSEGPPAVFETMVFGGPTDGYQKRYSSWDDAEIGHKAVVRKAREAIRKPTKEVPMTPGN